MTQKTAAPMRHDELHDCIALALDSITTPSPRTLAEAQAYLKDALRLIGGAA